MITVSIDTAIQVTGLSRRTLWRRVKDGQLGKGETDERGRTMVQLNSLKGMLVLPIPDEDLELLAMADQGHADSQSEVGIMFLEFEMPEIAAHWFTLAAKQGHADAMQHLSRLYFNGEGVERDDDLGQKWLAQAAAEGHTIARTQMAVILSTKDVPPLGG